MEKFLMWFINEKRQVIELKWRSQKKWARRMATRPEPTIIGNCDSWIFIVGKKPAEKSPPHCPQGKLPAYNKQNIHRLCTGVRITTLDKLCALGCLLFALPHHEQASGSYTDKQ
jgi:hypothetical protein